MSEQVTMTFTITARDAVERDAILSELRMSLPEGCGVVETAALNAADDAERLRGLIREAACDLYENLECACGPRVSGLVHAHDCERNNLLQRLNAELGV